MENRIPVLGIAGEKTMTEATRFPGEIRRERMCGSKKRYVTEELAYTEVRKMRRKNIIDNRNKTNTYLCPFCHYWHIGGEART